MEGSIVVVEIEMFEGLCMDLQYETVEMITDLRKGKASVVGQPCSSLGIRPPNPEPHFFFILEDLHDLQRGLIVSAYFSPPPSALALGPAVNLVRMSGGEVQRRLGCARADPGDHSR